MTLPVSSANVGTAFIVEVLGPITAPSILVCATVQWGVLVDNASAIQIIKSPCSHFYPAYVPASLTLYVWPTS